MASVTRHSIIAIFCYFARLPVCDEKITFQAVSDFSALLMMKKCELVCALANIMCCVTIHIVNVNEDVNESLGAEPIMMKRS